MIIKPMVRKIHLWLMMVSGLPLLIVSLTGAMLVFPDRTEAWLTAADFSPPRSDTVLPPSLLIEAVEAQCRPRFADALAIERLVYPTGPDKLMLVDLASYAAWVDPSNGEIRQFSADDTGLMRVVLRLHTSLLAGDPGRWITGTTALLLMLLCLTGLWLWRPVGRLRKDYFLIQSRRGLRRLNFDAHRIGGFYASGLLLLIAATGASMTFYDVVAPVVYFATGSQETPPGDQIRVGSRGGDLVSPDEALAIALRVHPGLEPRRLYIPSDRKKPYRVFLDPPGEHEWRIHEVRMEIDSISGEILQSEGPATMSRGDKILRWILPLHFGTFGGVATKLIYLVVCLSPLALSFTGTRLWWLRRRKQAVARAVCLGGTGGRT